MIMTATCGIQKFRWRVKIKHVSKYWGVVNTGRPLPVRYWGGGRDPCNPCGVDAYVDWQQVSRACRVAACDSSPTIKPRILIHYSAVKCNQRSAKHSLTRSRQIPKKYKCAVESCELARYTGWAKKRGHKLMNVILSILNRFKNFFHWKIPR